MASEGPVLRPWALSKSYFIFLEKWAVKMELVRMLHAD